MNIKNVQRLVCKSNIQSVGLLHGVTYVFKLLFTIRFLIFICIFVEYDNPHTLVVLAEEEIVFIDLESDDWLPFRMPYLSSLHYSPITCTQHYSDVPQDLWNNIVTFGNKQIAGKYTERVRI